MGRGICLAETWHLSLDTAEMVEQIIFVFSFTWKKPLYIGKAESPDKVGCHRNMPKSW